MILTQTLWLCSNISSVLRSWMGGNIQKDLIIRKCQNSHLVLLSVTCVYLLDFTMLMNQCSCQFITAGPEVFLINCLSCQQSICVSSFFFKSVYNHYNYFTCILLLFWRQFVLTFSKSALQGFSNNLQGGLHLKAILKILQKGNGSNMGVVRNRLSPFKSHCLIN